MRVFLAASLLVAGFRLQLGRHDLQLEQVASAAEVVVGDSLELLKLGSVDERVFPVAVGHVRGHVGLRVPFPLYRDVVDPPTPLHVELYVDHVTGGDTVAAVHHAQQAHALCFLGRAEPIQFVGRVPFSTRTRPSPTTGWARR